jgi:hypothetical protein
MSKSKEEARRQLEADERARQAQSHGKAWKSGQTIDTTDGKGNQKD